MDGSLDHIPELHSIERLASSVYVRLVDQLLAVAHRP
jgi:hypothetical protein